MEKKESKFVQFAEGELKRTKAGESIYGDMVPRAVMELVRVFDNQRHSEMSAQVVSMLFNELANWRELYPPKA